MANWPLRKLPLPDISLRKTAIDFINILVVIGISKEYSAFYQVAKIHAMLLQQYTYTFHNDLGFFLDITFVQFTCFRINRDLTGDELACLKLF